MTDQHLPADPNAGHERTDASAGSLTKFGAGLGLMIIVSMAAMWALLKFFGTQPPDATTSQPATAVKGALPPEPRLQAHPTMDMERFTAWEDSVLTTYGWVDRGRGTVRVPIDSAIAMMAKKGFAVDAALAGDGDRGSRTGEAAK